MIETRLLRQFIAVAEELNFHRAAGKLNMAQPPLSQAMTRLEARLGFPLFARSKRGVKLTAAGADFLLTARQLMRELDSGIARARDVSRGIAGALSLTTISFACYPRIIETLRDFRGAYPRVRLSIKEMPSSNQAAALAAGETDVAILRRLPSVDETIEFRLLQEDEIILAIPSSDARADTAEVNLRDFADDGFVFTPQSLGSGYHNQLVRICAGAGFYPKIIQEVQYVQTQIGLVGAGFGVALLPASIADTSQIESVVYRRLSQAPGMPIPSVGLHVAWKHDRQNPMIAAFLGIIDRIYLEARGSMDVTSKRDNHGAS